MTLMKDLTRQIETEIKLLTSNKQINLFLTSTEQKLGLKRKQIIYCNVNSFYYFFDY